MFGGVTSLVFQRQTLQGTCRPLLHISGPTSITIDVPATQQITTATIDVQFIQLIIDLTMAIIGTRTTIQHYRRQQDVQLITQQLRQQDVQQKQWNNYLKKSWTRI